MITSLETIRNYHLRATDGEFGRVRDVLIEEGNWTARWLVADTGNWLLGRKVLVSPLAFGEPDAENRVVPVDLTREEIESSPHLDEDAPVSRAYEKSFFDHYQWPYYWYGGFLWGRVDQPTSLSLSPNDPKEPELEAPESPEAEAHPLRSGHELTKYRLISGGDVLGYVEDVKLDSATWSVKYFQFDTRKWFHGLTLQLSPEKITGIDWPEHALYTEITEAELDRVKSRANDEDPPEDVNEAEALIRAQVGVSTFNSVE